VSDSRGDSRIGGDLNHVWTAPVEQEIFDGNSRGDAARIGGVGLQTIRDWVLRFNAKGPDGLIDGKAPGRAPKLNDAQRQELARMVESGPEKLEYRSTTSGKPSANGVRSIVSGPSSTCVCPVPRGARGARSPWKKDGSAEIRLQRWHRHG
jgi:hypothetical protein